MARPRDRVMFAVETGWQGMRETSLELARQNCPVDVIIKGRLAPEILEVITRPNRGYSVSAIPNYFFRIYLFWYLLRHNIAGDLSQAVVSKERTRRWVSRLCGCAKLLIETKKGYEVK